MADYSLTDAQIMQLAYRVRGLIRAESKTVMEVPMVDTLEGIESFPVVQKIGGISKYVRAHVSLLSQPAWDAVKDHIEDLKIALDEVDTATEESKAVTIESRVEIEKCKRATERALDALSSSQKYTDQTVATETTARESGDRATLTSAKVYADNAVANLVNGSPEALDTLKELSDALGNDPNFAATVAAQIGGKVDKITDKGLSTEDYTTIEKSKLSGIAAGANNYQHPATHPASMVVQDSTHLFVTDTEKTTWENKADKTFATTAAAGLMSANDKQKLDGVANGANKYQHPASHPASMIIQDDTHRFTTDAEKTKWNAATGGIPALAWKLEAGQLWVKPSCAVDDPILQHCCVGFLHLKNRTNRFRKNKQRRPNSKGYVLTDAFVDSNPLLSWVPRYLHPVKFDVEVAETCGGWMPVATVNDLTYRFVEKIQVDGYINRISYRVHCGSREVDGINGKVNDGGQQAQSATVRLGVVLFTGEPSTRTEGPRSYFQAWVCNSFDNPRLR